MTRHTSPCPECRNVDDHKVGCQYGQLEQAAETLYLTAFWQAKSSKLSPDQQNELWKTLKDTLRLPENEATRHGVGAK